MQHLLIMMRIVAQNHWIDICDMNISVAGIRYVGLSIATLLVQYNKVTAVDVILEKTDKINDHISPTLDKYIENFVTENDLDVLATLG